MNGTEPLRHLLREPFTDADVVEFWPAVERRRERAADPGRAWQALGTVLVAAAMVLLLARASTVRRPPTGPLRLADGSPVASLAGPASGESFRFDDGSMVALRPGARLVPRRNDARVFATTLVAGSARFEVRPGGPRRWSIDAGVATVQVLGTSFTLERRARGLRVAVEHGRVQVDSSLLAGSPRILPAGASLDLEGPAAAPVLAAAEPAPGAPVPVVTAPRSSVAARPSRAVPVEERWRSLARDNDYRGAWDALGAGGLDRRARDASAEDLLALGTVAHRSRHYAEAAELFGRFVAGHAAHPQASTVAFTLGRLQLDQLGDARAASRSFETSLRLGISRDLQEHVWVRRVEALVRSGDRAGARAAAEEYLRRFPEGARAGEVRRWVE